MHTNAVIRLPQGGEGLVFIRSGEGDYLHDYNVLSPGSVCKVTVPCPSITGYRDIPFAVSITKPTSGVGHLGSPLTRTY